MLKLNICAKKLFFFLAFVFLIASLSFYEIKPTKADTETTTKTYYSLSYDGNFEGITDNYVEAHDLASADIYDGFSILDLGQKKTGSWYAVFRDCLYFDTSAIPDDANKTNATLSLNRFVDYSATDFDIVIQNGQPTYPHAPMQTTDFNYAHYSGNGGSLNTASLTSGYNNITLNSDGLSWINVKGITKLCLRSSRDISKIAPSGDEYVVFYSSENGFSKAPILTITYEVGGLHYVIHAPYQEDSGLAYNGIVNVTVSFPTLEPSSFYMNGTSGNAETYTVNSTEQPTLISWNITTDYGHSRMYVLRMCSFDEVWLYVPNPDYTVVQYTISIVDFAGLTNATVEVDKNIGGYNRVIERANLDVYNGMTFWLTMYNQYSLKLISNEATIVWGLLADGQQSKTFVVTKDMIPSEYTGENATISVTRPTSTLISIYYSESRTTWINSTIYSYSASGYKKVANQYDVGTTQNYNTTVNATENYVVQIVAMQNGEQRTWQFSLTTEPSANIWTGIMDVFGIWPFNPVNAFGMFIVLCFFCVGSWRDTEFFLGVGIIIAAALTLVGFVTFPWLGISTCLFVVFLMYVHRGKVAEAREF